MTIGKREILEEAINTVAGRGKSYGSVASNFGAAEDCAGTAFAPAIAGMGAAIFGDATNDLAQLQFVSSDINSQPMYFSFSYSVI